MSGARSPVDTCDGRMQLKRRGTAIVGAGVLRSFTNRIQLQDGEERDFRKAVLWLRDARSTQPAVRVEVVGLADARGPLGSAIVTNVASVAAWPAPDHGEYYLSVAPGANAREL